MSFQKYCEVCGQELSEGIKFCPKCGDPVEQKEAPAPVEVVEKYIPKPPIDLKSEPSKSVPTTFKTEELSVKPKPTPFFQRSKRMGGGIPTLFGGLILLGLVGYQIFSKLTISFEAVVLGLIGIFVGIFMLRVRNIKNFILVFLGSLILFLGSGYQFYSLIRTFNTIIENPAEITSRPDLVIYVISIAFILYGFSRAFRSVFISQPK